MEAEERNKKFQLLNATLADKLQELRNKIMQARHAANGIHVSIKSQREEDGAGCIRSYHPSNLEPSTTTSITLNYAIESDQRNGVLLYLPSGTSV
ncbi:unnamed protein product, partial [Timema podura]|nr:unnamed protein product [Timema podura]